ncbi:MAG: xanthine dehydrogenase family protein molybdopterin-binding subunit [Phycisphaerales bacterium JB038]
MPKQERIPTSMPIDNRPANLGDSMDDDTSRLDAVAKVTGRAKYPRDTYLPGSLFAAFVRCPCGKGTLESYDRRAAMNVPGVIDVQIEREQGRYHGHTVGHLLAESPTALRRGMRALAAVWEREEAVPSLEAALDPSFDTNAETQQLLDGAAHVVEATYTAEVQTHAPLETHGASITHDGEQATAYVSTQGIFGAHASLRDPIGLPSSKYEVICEYMGGGFGSKLNGAGKEGALAARLAAEHKKPVYVFVDRKEDHLDTGNRPSMRVDARIGLAADGTILGGRLQTWGGVGVAQGGGGARIPSGRYRLGELQREHRDVSFNAGAPRPFRAPGCPQGAFAEELLLDEIAAKADLDPLELRLKLLRSADQREMLEYGAKLIGWQRRRANGAQEAMLRHGFGVATGSWGRYHPPAEAEVIIHRDGSVESRSGTQDIGTGQRTVVGVVAATQLGVPLHYVQARVGSTALPPGPTSGGSVTAHNTAPAIMQAADRVKAKLLDVLARELGGDASELNIVEGVVQRDGDKLYTWEEACRKIPGDSLSARGARDEEAVQAYDGEGHSEGAQFVELTVDVETGVIRVQRILAIQACGRVICRKTAENQILGGVAQGVSYALFENRLLDRNTGSMVNADLEFYKIAGPADVPHIEPILWTKGQTGVRSLGEPPTIPTAGAIAGAVYNAIGTPVRSLPITPDKVLAALEGGGA